MTNMSETIGITQSLSQQLIETIQQTGTKTLLAALAVKKPTKQDLKCQIYDMSFEYHVIMQNLEYVKIEAEAQPNTLAAFMLYKRVRRLVNDIKSSPLQSITNDKKFQMEVTKALKKWERRAFEGGPTTLSKSITTIRTFGVAKRNETMRKIIRDGIEPQVSTL